MLEDLIDMRGIELEVGQYVAYGKSNIHNPMGMGVITEITDTHIVMMANGGSRPSKSHICMQIE